MKRKRTECTPTHGLYMATSPPGSSSTQRHPLEEASSPASPSSVDDVSFSVENIINRATVRHSLAIHRESRSGGDEAEAPLSAPPGTQQAEVVSVLEALVYMETATRLQTVTQEAAEFASIQSRVSAHRLTRRIVELEDSEVEGRQEVADEENRSRLLYADLERQWVRTQRAMQSDVVPSPPSGATVAVGATANNHAATVDVDAAAIAESEGTVPPIAIREESSSAPDGIYMSLSLMRKDSYAVGRMVWAEMAHQLALSEGNVRYTIQMREAHDRTAFADLFETILEDIEDADGEACRAVVCEALREQCLLQIADLLRGEGNLRYGIEFAQQRDRSALVHLAEELLEALEEEEGINGERDPDLEGPSGGRRAPEPDATPTPVERQLDFAPGPSAATPIAVAVLSNEPQSYGGVAVGSPLPPAASPPRRSDVFPRYISPKPPSTVRRMIAAAEDEEEQRRLANRPPPPPAIVAPEWLLEDESADRQNVLDEWELRWHLLRCAIASYMPQGVYDWVLAGPRQVVRSDGDMFKTQQHLPPTLRLPQKHMLHERLGLLERCRTVLLGTPAEAHAAATSPVPSLNTLGGAYGAAKWARAQRNETHSAGRSGSATQAPPHSLAQNNRSARNDSLLQSLLQQEHHTRELISADEIVERRVMQKQCDEDLHEEWCWSKGWVMSPNTHRAPRPASHTQRHLPAGLRTATDPRPPPTSSPRPPAELFITPSRRAQDSAAGEVHALTCGARRVGASDDKVALATLTPRPATHAAATSPSVLRLPVPPQIKAQLQGSRPSSSGVVRAPR